MSSKELNERNKMVYREMDANMLAELLYKKLFDEKLDVTFWADYTRDDIAAARNAGGKFLGFSSCYGIQKQQIFDEELGVLLIGYWGGGTTRLLDLSYQMTEQKLADFIAAYFIENFLDTVVVKTESEEIS